MMMMMMMMMMMIHITTKNTISMTERDIHGPSCRYAHPSPWVAAQVYLIGVMCLCSPPPPASPHGRSRVSIAILGGA